MKYYIYLIISLLIPFTSLAQFIQGQVQDEKGEGIPFVTVFIKGTTKGTQSNEQGFFSLPLEGIQGEEISISALGFAKKDFPVSEKTQTQVFVLSHDNQIFEEVVVSGTLNPVSRLDSPVPVEIYTPQFFARNPTSNVFSALQNVNGVRPQVNCNVCNTGDIHVNGLEGPYTMVLLDGMPIVSGLSTVYGLSGIPNSMIERMEIVKGPASSLYGSEAVGGLINIITKTPEKAPKISFNANGNTWGEFNIDIGQKAQIGKMAKVLTGINYFNYSFPKDLNGDHFTDLTLQKRISVFQKWTIGKSKIPPLSLAARFFYEDRWGGEMNWNKSFRGTDSVYGESIYTTRWELLGQYILTHNRDLQLSFSLNRHIQNSFYGQVPFHAKQDIGFGQLLWNKHLGSHQLLGGLAMRYTHYDDDTPATASPNDLNVNKPSITPLPGIFIQDELKINPKFTGLFGYRFDIHPIHGGIHTPRIALKYSPKQGQTIRLNAGTGFRVVNIFTEDHAALTGARKVVIEETLKPEKSMNVNLNYMTKIALNGESFLGLDLSAFYTYFTNRISPDYSTDVQEIIYRNLNGHALSQGISGNLDYKHASGIYLNAGFTLLDNTMTQNGEKIRPLLSEHFQSTWGLGFPIRRVHAKVDYTGNLYSPMKLPLLGDLDPRPEYSPWWSIQNIQITYGQSSKNWEIYFGVKNLLNYTPPKNSIARPFDPFDKQVEYDTHGDILATENNPYALSFDPSNVFAPNQRRRLFFGLRMQLD
ncbi:TonB-dependent receptor [Marinilongibacter aquaticus]|uniref:TonB-dependent receptor n=1 Tax=Marinilongibacter aquaticus TaxID=2975157 RepID=UPI0021BD8504|nr:TonB-dependent receptor [Marinilongibacter aquaticus]UBM58392.1 TonB-dependent receptor [Marinilongibacter aquaticus]